MLLLHGIYRFSETRVGFRHSNCIHCKEPRLTEQYRTFNFWHVIFVSVLPLGFVKNWRCATCGKNPNPVRERPAVLIAGAVVLGLFGAFMFVGGFLAKRDQLSLIGMGLGMLFFSALCVWVLKLQLKADQKFAAANVVPIETDNCPYCPGKIRAETFSECNGCGARRV